MKTKKRSLLQNVIREFFKTLAFLPLILITFANFLAPHLGLHILIAPALGILIGIVMCIYGEYVYKAWTRRKLEPLVRFSWVALCRDIAFYEGIVIGVPALLMVLNHYPW